MYLVDMKDQKIKTKMVTETTTLEGFNAKNRK